jgi:fructokinase
VRDPETSVEPDPSTISVVESQRLGLDFRHGVVNYWNRFQRGEEQSINVPGAAPLPCSLAGVVSQGARAIAVAGEAIVDFVLEPGGGTTPRLGGGSFNAARTLGRLGLAPAFIGRLSTDRYGCALRRGLEESGVNLDGIVTTDDPTTFAHVELDAYGTPSYRFYIDGTSMAGLRPEEARAAMPARAAALHIGGLGVAVQPQATSISALVREAGSETLVLVDPNCHAHAARARPGFRERLRDLIRFADIVKTSEADLVYLEPDQSPQDTARALLARGPAVVLLTNGRLGATVLTTRDEAFVEAPRVDVIDTIGAGDAFGAAWIGGWVADGLRRGDLGDFNAVLRVADFAALVAARTCERAGAEPPRAAKVDAEWCFV